MAKDNGEKKKLNMANLSWGWLWGILVVLVGLMLSPADLVPEIVLGPLGLTDDAAYLAGIIKVVSEMVEKYQMEKTAKKADKTSQQTNDEDIRDVDSN